MHWIVLLTACLGLAACTQTLSVSIKTQKDLNPDNQGQALPVLVKFFQVRDPEQFSDQSFQELWQTTSPHYQISLAPNQRVTLPLEREQHARYLGVVAGFHHLEAEKWRALTPIPSKPWLWLRRFNVTLTHHHLTVE